MLETLERLLTRVWREHDVEGALAGLPQDFEWLVPGFPGTEATRGPEATLDFFRDWIDQWEELQVDWELEQAGPDTVFAVVDMRGLGRASGVPVELRFAQVWSFRESVPVRMVFHADVEEGRSAAGLAPPSAPPSP
jgi:ketosteroid isomerase-like protein